MHTPPPIIGYRPLTEQEVAHINQIKAAGQQLESLIAQLSEVPGVDPRWLAVGRTDLQTGLMALTRAVARPTAF